MKKLLPLLVVLLAACGSGTTISPSPTPSPAPSPAPAPAPQPAPAPAVPNFAGSWIGEYLVSRCDNTGAFSGNAGLCRETFPTGRALPIQAVWTQSGTGVNGYLILGSMTTQPGGNVIRNGELTFNARLFQDEDVRADASITVRSTRAGIIDPGGVVHVLYTVIRPGSAGNVTIDGTIRTLNRF